MTLASGMPLCCSISYQILPCFILNWTVIQALKIAVIRTLWTRTSLFFHKALLILFFACWVVAVSLCLMVLLGRFRAEWALYGIIIEMALALGWYVCVPVSLWSCILELARPDAVAAAKGRISRNFSAYKKICSLCVCLNIYTVSVCVLCS